MYVHECLQLVSQTHRAYLKSEPQRVMGPTECKTHATDVTLELTFDNSQPLFTNHNLYE